MIAVGLLMWPTIEVDSRVLAYLLHPALRAILESARLIAALSLILAAFQTIVRWDDLDRFVKAVVIGGSISALYGAYQAIALRSGLSLPMLPGTLYQLSPRPFSTFYEPTAFGSFAAVSALLAMYLATTRRASKLWMVACVVNLGGLALSLSAAGALAFAAGLLTLVLLSPLRATIVVPSLVVVLIGAISAAGSLLDQEVTDVSMSGWWFYTRLDERFAQYVSAVEEFREYPFGLGVGNYLLRGQGAYGAARLAVEGGAVGVILLLLLYASSWTAAGRLSRTGSGEARRFGPFAGAASVAVFVVSLNYINTTDSWLWVLMTLPLLGWSVHVATIRAAREAERSRAERLIATHDDATDTVSAA